MKNSILMGLFILEEGHQQRYDVTLKYLLQKCITRTKLLRCTIFNCKNFLKFNSTFTFLAVVKINPVIRDNYRLFYVKMANIKFS